MVIDIFGCIPIVIQLRNQTGEIHSFKATVSAGLIMIVFLFLGEYILRIMGIDIASFAIAGSVIIFIIALEMVLGRDIVRNDSGSSGTIVPLAFPIIAGAGTITTLISLKDSYSNLNVIIAILINLVIVFLVLYYVPKIEKLLGKQGIQILRKVFGIILLAIAIKMFKNYIAI